MADHNSTSTAPDAQINPIGSNRQPAADARVDVVTVGPKGVDAFTCLRTGLFVGRGSSIGIRQAGTSADTAGRRTRAPRAVARTRCRTAAERRPAGSAVERKHEDHRGLDRYIGCHERRPFRARSIRRAMRSSFSAESGFSAAPSIAATADSIDPLKKVVTM